MAFVRFLVRKSDGAVCQWHTAAVESGLYDAVTGEEAAELLQKQGYTAKTSPIVAGWGKKRRARTRKKSDDDASAHSDPGPEDAAGPESELGISLL